MNLAPPLTHLAPPLFILNYLQGYRYGIQSPLAWDAEFNRCCAEMGDELICFEPSSGIADIAPIVLAVKALRRRPDVFLRVFPALVAHAGPKNIQAALDAAEAKGSTNMVHAIQQYLSERSLALAMGSHPRLGAPPPAEHASAGPRLWQLDAELLRYIDQQSRGI